MALSALIFVTLQIELRTPLYLLGIGVEFYKSMNRELWNTEYHFDLSSKMAETG